ncbi:hypothetical protein CK203_038183 [Vitis vinifera]|uniref:Uncharacterized protein n=1 Tax=Vitis vinifera TaxID=29760 RepID=A0A438IBS9_VITVI|nr:hypothetical protein CK203_038183 [Vitis vinifera]
MPNISWMSFKSFNNQEVEGLNALFYEEEVFRALSNLNKDKAVGLDGGAEYQKDFKLMSLVGGLYKLVVEVLVNRLKRLVGRVVFEFQN